MYTRAMLASLLGVSISFVNKRVREDGGLPQGLSGIIDEDLSVLRVAFAKRPRKQPTQNYTCADCGKQQTMSSGRRRRFCKECLPTHAGLRYSRFGLTERGYLAMYDSQDGKCKICDVSLVHRKTKGSTNFACVDHDHETGKVRGLLCPGCNTKLSGIEDAQWHQRAVEYLVGMHDASS